MPFVTWNKTTHDSSFVEVKKYKRYVFFTRKGRNTRHKSRKKKKSVALILIPPYLNRHVYYVKVTTKFWPIRTRQKRMIYDKEKCYFCPI